MAGMSLSSHRAYTIADSRCMSPCSTNENHAHCPCLIHHFTMLDEHKSPGKPIHARKLLCIS